MFAIITFRDTGPIKTWSAMRAANVHNARTKPLEHAVAGAPAPQHLIGRGDLVGDVKRLLRAAQIDPDRLRKNGVIAYEAILSASPEFYLQGDDGEREQRLRNWTKAQVDWASARYGAHRIASMVLHLDEKTPHIHLVVLPLEVKSDGRRRDGKVRWSLVGRTVSGPGRFDEIQDAYAAAMAPFGLQRGVRGSGRKHEPVPVFLERMAAKERAVDQARDLLVHEKQAVTADRAKVDAARVELLAADRALADREQRFEALVIEADRLHKERWDDVDQQRAEQVHRQASLDAREAALTAAERRVAQDRDELEREKTAQATEAARIDDVAALAEDFLRRVVALPPADLVPRVQAVAHLAEQVVQATAPAPARRPALPVRAMMVAAAARPAMPPPALGR